MNYRYQPLDLVTVTERSQTEKLQSIL